MTPDERQLLSRFLDELVAARGTAKDPEADGMIGRALAANPDAAYLLVQHAIVADQSLHAARARIEALERQAPAPAPQSSSFLPPRDDGPWGSAPAGGYAPPPPAERPGIFSGGGGLGSFLRSAGTTAAGVAGGEMLFSGLSDMFGGHHGGGGLFGGGQGFADRPEEVVVDNYGDDDDGRDRFDDGGDQGLGDDNSGW